MKSFIYILLTSLTFLVVGCQNESEEIRLINQAERLFDAYPDSVITTLDSIPLPEEMSPRLIARWCMLYARAADKIEDEMPYTNQLEIALKYYQKKKMREEEAEIGLYLGRSYVEDKEYEKAMRAYSDALEVALAIKNYNRAGYICSYMGDLYELDLVLRNNITTIDCPLGLFHPHTEYHHIKKENIGLIEVMGLAVLPARLKKEMAELEQAILNHEDLRQNETVAAHAEWAEGWIPKYKITDSNIHSIIQKEIGIVFAKVLEDAGVYKRTDEGKAAFKRFIESL